MKFKHLYLLLAIIGLTCTWYYNIQFYLKAEDTSIFNFIKLTKTTIPAKSIIADISVVVITFLIWMIYESQRLKIKYWWVIFVLTFFIAVAFSLPLFLYLRQNRIDELSRVKKHKVKN